MKALTWQGKNTLKLVEVPKPVLVDPRDAILKVTGTTVCGSDLHMLHGSIIEMEKGDILGHEFCGVVESLGPEAQGTDLRVGDRVVACFPIACGSCTNCQKKLTSQCEKTNSNHLANKMWGGRTSGIYGYGHITGGIAGGQAEYVRVPYADINLLKLPDDVPDERGLYLSDVLATAHNAIVDTGVDKGDVVAIWGAGPIGQMAIDFAWLAGASRVIIIDNNWRLDYVKQRSPNVETLNFAELPKDTSVPDRLKEMVHGDGPDVALECVAGEYAKSWTHYMEMQAGLETDTSEILNECITSVRAYGKIGITGVYVGYTNHFNIGAIMERGLRLIGNGQAPVQKYWVKLLDWIRIGKIEPLKMVTHRALLDDIETLYDQFAHRADGMQKVFIQTKFSGPAIDESPPLTVQVPTI